MNAITSDWSTGNAGIKADIETVRESLSRGNREHRPAARYASNAHWKCAVKSGWLDAQGQLTEKFGNDLAEWIGRKLGETPDGD